MWLIITRSVGLWDSNAALIATGSGRRKSRRKDRGKTPSEPADRCSLSVQLLYGGLNVGLNLSRGDDTPVDKFGVGAAKNFQISGGFGVPERGVILMERNKSY